MRDSSQTHADVTRAQTPFGVVERTVVSGARLATRNIRFVVTSAAVVIIARRVQFSSAAKTKTQYLFLAQSRHARDQNEICAPATIKNIRVDWLFCWFLL